MNLPPLSRRQLLKEVFQFGGTLAAGIFLSGCDRPDRIFEQVLGPFFPDPGDPVTPIRELGEDSRPYPKSNDWDLTQVIGRQHPAKGQVVTLTGRVLDPAGHPIPRASLMLWQASSTGRYNHQGDSVAHRFTDPRGKVVERSLDPDFQYWGHCLAEADGTYRFKTILPGYYPADLQRGWFRPPHLHFIVQTPGLPELVTQTYFKGDALADNAFYQELNARDYILRDPAMSREEQERLIVDYAPAEDQATGLQGTFDFRLREHKA